MDYAGWLRRAAMRNIHASRYALTKCLHIAYELTTPRTYAREVRPHEQAWSWEWLQRLCGQ